MTNCGLWLARRRLVAVLLGPAGDVRRTLHAALTDDARYGLIEYLAGAELEIVLTEALARSDLVALQAVRRGMPVWTVDDGLAAALLGAAGIRNPTRAAALLARLPRIALLRASLRRLTPPEKSAGQLPLL